MAGHPTSSAFQDKSQTAYAGAQELWAGEEHLQRYNRDVVAMLSRCCPGQADVLEFGAGIGTLAQIWHARTGTKPECLEIDPALRQVLEQRAFRCHADAQSIAKTFDLVYTSNVLEHIEDDVSALRRIRTLLKPKGRLAIFVPACPSIYSDLDAAVGHFRRYGRSELRQKVEAAGFTVDECRFVDSIGYLAWWSTKVRSYDGNTRLGDGSALATYDRYIFPLSKLLDALGMKHLLGKNLLLMAHRHDR